MVSLGSELKFSFESSFEDKTNDMIDYPRSRKVLLKARALGYKGTIAGTRKTTPG